MKYSVSVVLKSGELVQVNLREDEVNAFDGSSAWDWIAGAFERAGLESPSPTGKILLKDQILLLALEQKSGEWAVPTPELRKLLAAAVKSLGSPTVTIDLKNARI